MGLSWNRTLESGAKMGGFPNYPELHSGMNPPRGPRPFRNGPGVEKILHVPGFSNAAARQLKPLTCRQMMRG